MTGVKEGSFYYFFDSKADLALAALDEEWSRRRQELDAVFSPTIPPLQRLQNLCTKSYQIQAEIKEKYGSVLGCPQFCLGAEICTQEDLLQKKVQEMLEYKRMHIESAIRDAHAAGLVDAPDAAAKSRTVFAYYQGLLTQARIQNNLEILREAAHGSFEVLGVLQEPASTTG